MEATHPLDLAQAQGVLSYRHLASPCHKGCISQVPILKGMWVQRRALSSAAMTAQLISLGRSLADVAKQNPHVALRNKDFINT